MSNNTVGSWNYFWEKIWTLLVPPLPTSHAGTVFGGQPCRGLAGTDSGGCMRCARPFFICKKIFEISREIVKFRKTSLKLTMNFICGSRHYFFSRSAGSVPCERDMQNTIYSIHIIIIIIIIYNRARFFVAPLIMIFNSRAREVGALRELRLKSNYLSHVSRNI
jgi:hypothetical protein